jgi:hypothetical protein
LIIPMLLSGSLFATQVNDTVWWNTPGAKVIEHREQNPASCSLMFYNDDGNIIFDWDASGKLLVIATDRRWNFPDSNQMPVAVEVGDVWLTNHSGSEVIDAVAHGTDIGFFMNQAIDDLLRPASRIEVKASGANLTVSLTPAKMSVLLSRTRDCRGAMKGGEVSRHSLPSGRLDRPAR